jgi:FAD synthase
MFVTSSDKKQRKREESDNPTYGNKEKTCEPHFIAPKDSSYRTSSICGETQLPDFYGEVIKLSICGYIRQELPFEGLEKLVEAIKNDIKITEEKCCVESEGNKRERDWCGGIN